MMDGYFVAGLVLLLAALGTSGCGSYLDTAIRIENVASVAAATAQEEIKDLCKEAMDHADTPAKADVVISTCGKAEDAYTVFRDAWLAAADAIRLAQIGQKPLDFDQVLAAVESAQRDLFALIDAIRGMA